MYLHNNVLQESISGIPLNIWLKCFELLPSKTPPTPLSASVSSKSRVHHVIWEELCDWSVSENTCCHDFAKEQARIANEIHCLLDHIPWDVEGIGKVFVNFIIFKI